MSPSPASDRRLALAAAQLREHGEVYRGLASQVRGGTVLQAGVGLGLSLAFILDVCRENGNRLIAVDPWAPGDHLPAQTLAGAEAHRTFLRNLAYLGHERTVEVVRSDCAEAALRFDDGSLDLVFLGEDHAYHRLKRDLPAWLPKVKPGGVLAGSGYTWFADVRRALRELVENRVSLLAGGVWRLQPPWAEPALRARGCILLPTFRDTSLMVENFAARPDLAGAADIHVVDDNFEARECALVEALCRENGWHYHRSGRLRHENWLTEAGDLSEFNRFLWDAITGIGSEYDYLVKVDTDTLIIEAGFLHEFASALGGRTALAGCLEYRPAASARAFREVAESHGHSFEPRDPVPHVQGGIAGYSREACRSLRAMGFLRGRVQNVGEDRYLSYCAMLLGMPLVQVHHSGSWWRPYRPPLDWIRHLKAIHPLTRSEWAAWKGPTE